VKRLIAIASIAALGSGCKLTSVYTQGPPRRVEIEKQVTEPSILAEGVRDAGGGVDLRVLELHAVRLTRHTQHGALETRIEHPGHPFAELIEFPLAAVIGMAIPYSLVMDSTLNGGKPGVKRDAFRPILAMLDPTRSMLASKARVYVAQHVTFAGATRIRQYNVRLPVGEVVLKYRVLDAGRDVLASGEVTTDQFGKVRIPDVSLHAVGIELIGTRVNLIAPIRNARARAAAPVPAAPPVEPAPPAEPAPPTSAQPDDPYGVPAEPRP